MSDLISDNYRILLVMSRFGIGLGVGEDTIGEVCCKNGVDTDTFLAVTNMLLDEDNAGRVPVDTVSLESLMSYLHNSHDYFLEFRLPAIREQLAGIVGDPDSDLSKAIIRYFDEYVAEVRNHMNYEDEIVFPYVRKLLEGRRSENYNIDFFRTHHDQVEARLTEFKQILIKYYPSRSSHQINGVLFDIFNCEYDLASHNAVEDRMFVPLVMELEKEVEAKR